MSDPKLEHLVDKLDQDPSLASRDLYKVLVAIRTKFMDQELQLNQSATIEMSKFEDC